MTPPTELIPKLTQDTQGNWWYFAGMLFGKPMYIGPFVYFTDCILEAFANGRIPNRHGR